MTRHSSIQPPPPQQSAPALPGLVIARWNDNELIFVDHQRRESWIVYPPRTTYSFARRVMAGGTLVERRHWSRLGGVEEHIVTAAEGCAAHGLDCPAHGLDCPAQAAIQAAIDTGFNPFL